MYRKLLIALLTFVLIIPVFAQEDPNVQITYPLPVYDVAGAVNIYGTANAANMRTYFLEAALYDAELILWTPVTLPGNTPVVDGVLGQWITTTLPDGIYQLRLHVVLTSGENIYDVVGPIRIANQIERPEGQPTVQVQVIQPTQPVIAEPTLVPHPEVVNELPVFVGGQVTHFTDETIALMQASGMTWVKWQIPYLLAGDINVYRDRINWSHEAGFKVLLSITGDLNELIQLGDDYYPIYAEFLGQVAALHPDAIEVWNEMNLDREWPRGRISSRAYVEEMLRPAYEAIKAADPEVMVISGAPAPTGFFGGCSGNGCDDDQYYFGMANAGVANYADCIGVHYNEGILPPTQQGGDPRDNYPTRYFPLMTNRAAAPFRGLDIPLCFTELGYLSPEGYGPLPGNFAWASSTSIAEQAEWLSQAIDLAGDDGRIALLIVFNVDFDRYDQEDPQAGYAIIRADDTCPACESIGALRGQ